MSLLPGQIIPASQPFGTLAPDGKSVLIDENWWLFLYNVFLNSVNSGVASGFLKSFNGRTASAVVPATGDYKLSMLGDVAQQQWEDGEVLTYVAAQSLWEAAPATKGTVLSVSVNTANGLAGTVDNPNVNPAITLSTTVTGMLKGNGAAISEATSGTDYSGGTSALDTGILKSTTGTGALSIAVPSDFPTLNQDTTGNAATATLASTVTTNANLTGPVTSTGNATAVTANAITNAMLAQSPAMTVKGNNTAATANEIDLTQAQLTAMLDAYAGSAQGLVPAGAGGTTNYLREDGTWAVPSGSATWGSITGTLSNQTDLMDEFALYGALGSANTWTNPQTFAAYGPTAPPELGNSAGAGLTYDISEVSGGWARGLAIINGSSIVTGIGAFGSGANLSWTMVGFGDSFYEGGGATGAAGMRWLSNGECSSTKNILDDGAGNMTIAGHITGPTPTLSSITINAGTVYQNTSGRWMNLYVGFSTVSTGTVQTFLGPTSSPSLTRSDDVVGNRTITLRVPPGWYYEFSGLATSGSSYALYEN